MKLRPVLILLGAFELCCAGRIFVLLPAPSKSHYILNEPLIEKLIERGHHITVAAPYKRSTPLQNLTEIILPDVSESMFKKFAPGNSGDGKFQMRNINPFLFLTFFAMAKDWAEQMMKQKDMEKLLTSDQKFDLVLGESFMAEGLIARLAHKFNAPKIYTWPSMPLVYLNEMIGNPAPSSFIPDLMLGYTDSMNFQQRVLNFLYTTFATFLYHNIYIPYQESLMKTYFGDDGLTLTQLLQKDCLILVNHHFSLAFPRPYNPNMVEIGGYHVRPPKPLRKDLEEFMNEATNGVIFFSMGSNLQSSEFPKEKFDGILRAFSRLKQRVLWKFENENPPNLPKNVKISKWLPQSDILAHPNVKLFITHGGLLSLTESLFRGVPVIGIPVFGDQPTNVNLVQKIGAGIKLEYDDIGEETLFSSIEEVLNNPKYRENAKLRSEILQDRPLPPVDLAVFWIEYVMRHKGVPHLKSAAQDLTWVQKNSFDVFAVVGLVVLVPVYVVKTLLGWLLRTFRGEKTKAVSSRKKKN